MKSVALNQLHTLSNRSILLLKTILQEEEREGLIFSVRRLQISGSIKNLRSTWR